MRIVAVSDLHYKEETRPRVEAIAKAACAADADVLVIAGDCAGEGPRLIPEALALFADFDGPRLMVAGNHDLWQFRPPFETARLLYEILPKIAAKYDFHSLDSAPFILGDTAFVGTIGWYDYSFRQTVTPVDGLKVTPIAASVGAEGHIAFEAVPGSREMSWEELQPEDYVPGGLVWQADGRPRTTLWMDVVRSDWGKPAEEMAAHFARHLCEQVASVAATARHVVGVTHFVPFVELSDYHLSSPTRAFARAHLGSPLLGEALLATWGLELVIHGHRHRQGVREVRGVVTVDAGVADQDVGPLLLTIPD